MPDVDALKHWAPGGPGQEEPLRQPALAASSVCFHHMRTSPGTVKSSFGTIGNS